MRGVHLPRLASLLMRLLMSNKKDQNTRVKAYLMRHGKISAADAVKHLGIYRLAARIYDLRSFGVYISTFKAKNTKGGGYHAVYHLG